MNRILLDAKKLLLGVDDSEKVPQDFKEEINNCVKNNSISKAMATLLMTARNNVDALGKKIVKKQEADVSQKGSRVKNPKEKNVLENDRKIIKEKEIKKEEEKEKKKRQQESLRQTMQKIAEEDEKNQNKTVYKNKDF